MPRPQEWNYLLSQKPIYRGCLCEKASFSLGFRIKRRSQLTINSLMHLGRFWACPCYQGDTKSGNLAWIHWTVPLHLKGLEGFDWRKTGRLGTVWDISFRIRQGKTPRGPSIQGPFFLDTDVCPESNYFYAWQPWRFFWHNLEGERMKTCSRGGSYPLIPFLVVSCLFPKHANVLLSSFWYSFPDLSIQYPQRNLSQTCWTHYGS